MSANGNFPFAEEFECGFGGWNTTDGSWGILQVGDTQVIQVTASSPTEVFLLPTGLPLLANLRVQARVRVLSFDETDVFARAGVYLRRANAGQYVGAAWTVDNHLASRSATAGGSAESYDGNAPLLTLGQWVTLGVAAMDDRVEILRDGNIVSTLAQVSDTPGEVALAARNAVVQFDDVVVSEY